MPKVPKRITNIFFDVDYTLVDFERGHQAAVGFFRKEISLEFSRYFDNIFHTILEGLRVKNENWQNIPGGKAFYDKMMCLMQDLQDTVEPKVWSRELYVDIISRELKLSFSPSRCQSTADYYWSTIVRYSTLYPEVATMIARLEQKKLSYHLFTSSDSRLVWQAGRWFYDPEHSMEKKEERLRFLQSQGISPVSITIGDPVDKPKRSFYELMLKRASYSIGRTMKPEECLIVGDSYQGDIESPMSQLDIGLGFWIQRGRPAEKISDRIYSIRSLSEIIF